MQNRILFYLRSKFALMAISLLFLGCSAQGFEGPTGTVEGKLTMKGQPLTPGTIVTFISVEGFAASGKTDSEGNFSLMFRGADQVPVSHYRVQLAPARKSEDPQFDTNLTNHRGRSAARPKRPFPEKYSASTTSGLEVDVREGSNLPLIIDLE
ncbi:hypothetical protein AB1K70_20015 [Bremerella sp. JC770]|uniref:hypothetical protein n=1 Tax=Bremerella sp. JC770 TaxID=3232137 RepID=UPI0034576C9C